MKKFFCYNIHAYALTFFLLTFSFSELKAQETKGDPVKGEEFFNTYCVACHKLDEKSIGPALGGIESKRTNEWLHKWIGNSQKLIASGDKDAIAIFEEYNKVPMAPYEGLLTKEQIDDILAYTSNPPKDDVVMQTPMKTVVTKGFEHTNTLLFIVAVVIFVSLIFLMYRANKMLIALAKSNNKEEFLKSHPHYPLWNIFLKNKYLIGMFWAVLFFGSTYVMFAFFMQVGVDQGYRPVQEIHYSHKIHAGDNQIDCKHCHSAARTSKTAGIPSLNVCMNCHKEISQYKGDFDLANGYTKEFYDNEIQKLYNAVGWDPVEKKYTGEEKSVKWTRIHNLPDHVYFNHSQHVSVGGVACQECHGSVEQMEIVHQDKPLTMGWCIDCHRTKEVNSANVYYEKIHQDLAKKKGVDKLTVADLGGMECGKCHY